jgi:hypothetical protein
MGIVLQVVGYVLSLVAAPLMLAVAFPIRKIVLAPLKPLAGDLTELVGSAFEGIVAFATALAVFYFLRQTPSYLVLLVVLLFAFGQNQGRRMMAAQAGAVGASGNDEMAVQLRARSNREGLAFWGQMIGLVTGYFILPS